MAVGSTPGDFGLTLVELGLIPVDSGSKLAQFGSKPVVLGC